MYTSYRSYRKHLLQKHPEFMNENVSGPSDNHADDVSADYDYFDEAQTALRDDITPIKHSLALFILKAKEERRIPQQALDGLLDDFHKILKLQMKALGENVMSYLEEQNCASHVICAVDKIISCTATESPFNGLHTAYLQQEYFKKHFHFVVSATKSYNSCFNTCVAFIGTCGTTTWSNQLSHYYSNTK